ncbi:hypothetical protein S3E15_05023 [Bacillus mycoides]|uniref:Uncharacterized protein n=1 Tax=Bacillus mycoides TaxID=1405 RepID=A0AAP8BEC8_BACMY|nr:hypothetical protein M2E15_5554 [Bacillus mycoides]KZE06151.1 hypothetical protein B4117_2208 [Bacillus mycoides]OSX92847.1 hypothetical protein S3E15_05023 [Bacillus mycoides]OSX99716.1 hypothetical protein BTJ44_06123 [Bacillus mycoides]OSY03387.1 hypothetical protein S2E19_02919 [Bacillus mycoides]
MCLVTQPTYTPKQVEQEAFHRQHYIIKNALDEVLFAYAR